MRFSTSISLALLASLALGVQASTTDRDGLRGESTPGQYGPQRTGEAVLVVRDFLPWGGDVVPYFVAAGANVTVTTTDSVQDLDLSQYCLVYTSGGTTAPGDPTATALQLAMPQLETYVAAGGDLLFFTGTWGATFTAPGGLTSSHMEQNLNNIDTLHPIGLGIPDPFTGNAASHDILFDVPPDATIIATDVAGAPTGVEYDLGSGHCTVLTMPIECYLETGVCGTFNYPHIEQIFVNAVDYTLSIAGCGTVDAVERPQSLALLGNHPNPFNPTTTIEFSLGETGSATLSVHDLAGRRIATLLQGTTEAGVHQVAFDATALPSGVYFSRLEAGGQSMVARMLLVK